MLYSRKYQSPYMQAQQDLVSKRKKILRGQSELQETLKKQTNKQIRISEKGGKRER